MVVGAHPTRLRPRCGGRCPPYGTTSYERMKGVAHPTKTQGGLSKFGADSSRESGGGSIGTGSGDVSGSEGVKTATRPVRVTARRVGVDKTQAHSARAR